jgi:multidrug resistance efflux pump
VKKTSLIFIFICVAILGLAACSPKTAEATTIPANPTPAVLIAEGRLLPVNTLDQSFSIPGQVQEVLVEDGELVVEGQALAHLQESPDNALALRRAEQDVLAAQQALDALQNSADLNLAQSQLALIQAQDTLDRAQTRYDDEATDLTTAELHAAKASLAMAEDTLTRLENGNGVDPDQQAIAEARLATAHAALASTQSAIDAFTLKAGMPGKVVDLNLKAGQQVSAGEPIITLADFSGWVVQTDNLSEVDVIGLEVGQKAEIVLDALPGVTLNGVITHINARFEEKRSDITYTVSILLTQADAGVRWGMTAAVRFIR